MAKIDYRKVHKRPLRPYDVPKERTCSYCGRTILRLRIGGSLWPYELDGTTRHRCEKPPTKLHRDAWFLARELGAKQVAYGRCSVVAKWSERQDPPASRKAAIRLECRTGLRWDEGAKRWVMTEAVRRRLLQYGFKQGENGRSWVKAVRESTPRQRVKGK
jgi:hypothetical protein